MAKKGKRTTSTGWYKRQEERGSPALGAAPTSKPRVFLTYSYLHADEQIIGALQQELSSSFKSPDRPLWENPTISARVRPRSLMQ